ncbi:MAG TPA: hypothetical protein PKJ24_09995 [Prolixibacteraceae bacterium]|nr:hypothetical protein [Prolixibacteraceae bacterium]
MKVTFLQLILILSMITSVAAGQDDLPVKKYSDNFSFREINDFYRNKMSAVQLVSWSRTSFLNAAFLSNKLNGNIRQQFGLQYNYRIMKLSPVLVDIGYNWGKYTISGSAPSALAGEDIIEQAFESSFSMFLFPATRYFLPYAGLGFNYTWLRTVWVENEDKELVADHVTVLPSPVWKTGFMSAVSETVVLFGEYKKSFASRREFTQLNLGIGFSF